MKPLFIWMLAPLLMLTSSACDPKKEADQAKAAASSAEAKTNLNAIGKGAMAYFASEHAVSDFKSTSKLYPKSPRWSCTSTGGVKPPSKPNIAEFRQSPWRDLRFTLTTEHAYRYCYKSGRKQKSFAAIAEIDGESSLCIRGSADKGAPVVSNPTESSRAECNP